MPDENQETVICRACLVRIESLRQSISIHSYAKTLLFENLLVKDMIEKCIPEMDIDICNKTVICTDCYDLLISTYRFRSKCLDTEERIYLFIEKNLQSGNKLDLNCVLEASDKKYEDENNKRNKVSINLEDMTNISGSESEDVIIVDITDNDTDIWKNPDRKALTKHLRKDYSCDSCEYKTRRKDLLRKHVTNKCKNRGESARYRCDQCSYSTFRKWHLTRHKFTHGGKRPFICGLCDKGFTEKNNIKNHMWMHSGYKFQYKCKEGDCDVKDDISPQGLTQVKQRKPFMCKLCNKALPDQRQWNLHMEKIHDLCFL